MKTTNHPGSYSYPAQRARQPVRNIPVRPRGGVPLLVWAALLALLGLALVILLPLGGFYLYFQFSHRIVPGVFVGGTRLGGLTTTQAAIAIQKDWNLQRQLAVTDGLHAWTLAPGELGLSVDPLATARAAYFIGHDQGILDEMDQLLRSWSQGWGVAPVVSMDAGVAIAGLEKLNQQASLAPVAASVRLEGDQVLDVPGQVGYEINIEQALKDISSNPLGIMTGGSVRLPLKPVPPGEDNVSRLKTELEQTLALNVTIKAYDPVQDEWQEWTVARQQIASWIKIQAGPDGAQMSLSEADVRATIEQFSAGLAPARYLDVEDFAGSYVDAVRNGTAITLIVHHNPTQYTVQSGDTLLKIGWKVGMPYWTLLQANPGMDENSLGVGQEIVIPSKDEMLPLPVVLNKRIVISISKQHLWAYQDGKLASDHVISTGIDRSPTQPGVFQVQTHEKNAYASVWDLYMPNFLGVYEAWPGFMNGIHGLPTLSNGTRLWASILGRPASYGCIILDLNAAKWLYDWADNGVVVEIQP